MAKKSSKRKSSGRKTSHRRKTLLGSKRTAAGPKLPSTGVKQMQVHVAFGRDKTAKPGHQMIACATFAKKTMCAQSSSPSKAIRSALNKVASANRSSALAGLAGTRRRRRSRR